MKDLVIIGAGGFGREVAWLVEEINENKKQWNLLGFIDDDISKQGKELNGYKILGTLEYLKGKENIYYVCAVGASKLRSLIVDRCNKFDLKAATLIHPNVNISKTNKIGEGSIITSRNIITVNCIIEEHVIINLNCTIGHDVIIKDFVTINPSVSISGNCVIEKCVQIGTGARIIQQKIIGENSIIGAGAVVVKDIEKNKTAVGVPAKIIK
ncbi:acetyltransferase [Clostridium tarantellae]|uniref:Transferase n=1 Tax=Clostridium tarantellae TaxID=39493 RepID=A0A6I1MMY7_9CLOT|nr:acetyltransferase [Clostridium tarantellae]MPQ44856.1 transferase [Clostridium tarantellae]